MVGARSPQRAQAFSDRHGVERAVGSYQEVLADDAVDAVYVALPNDLHEPWAVAALRAGKHVLCEKPLALDAAAARRVAATAAETGLLAQEAIMTRFHPRTRALLELVHGGGIGELRSITTAFCFRMDRPHDYRADPARGGGALLDVGVYGASMSRWLAGEEPGEIRAVARRRPSGVDGSTTALLGFPGGAVASVAASFDSAPVQLLSVAGTAGALDVPLPFTAGADAPLLRDGVPVGTWSADPYVEMVRAFASAAVAGVGAQEAPLPIADAVATADVLDAIYVQAARNDSGSPQQPRADSR